MDKIKNRDISLDTLKGFLIILVIFGHIIGSLNISGGEDIWNLIYTFHMPLFVLISGYFSKHEKLSLLSIIKPLIIFQFINIVLLTVLGYKFSFSYLLVPYWTLWYLLSLIFWRIILRYMPESMLNRPYLFLAITILLSIFVGTFIPHGRIFSIQRTISFLPFFMMGYYFKTSQIEHTLWNKNISYLLLVLISVFIIIIGYPSNANILLRGADPYTINDIPTKLFILVCTIVIIYSLWNIRFENRYLAKLGRESLFYYLYHGLIIKFLMVPIVAKFNLPANLLICIFYLILVIIFLYLLNKIKFFRWFVNPTLKYK